MEKQKRKEYIVKIGPLLRKVIDEQKQSIKEVTYDTIDASDYNAGEIVAKKVMGVA